MQERRTDQTTGRTRDQAPDRRNALSRWRSERAPRRSDRHFSALYRWLTAGSATTPNLPRGPHAEARPVVYRHHAARREQHAAPQRAPAQASYDGSWFRLSVRRPTGTGERRTVCHERVLHTSTSTRGSCHPKLATKVRYECCDNLATSAASDTQRTLTALGVPNV